MGRNTTSVGESLSTFPTQKVENPNPDFLTIFSPELRVCTFYTHSVVFQSNSQFSTACAVATLLTCLIATG